jgi:tripartite-type tricarboxylate transporter receptor subunit TctC
MWIVPTTPGGGLDVETRLYASKLATIVGKNVVVDNKPGAGSTMGAAHVAKAPPDGYTLVSLTPSHTISPLIYPALSYELQRDFEPISLTSKRPSLFVVPANSPVRTLRDYITMAKAKPGALNVGTVGAGTSGHLAMEWMHNLMDAKVTYVHYKGGTPAYTALVAQELHAVLGGVVGLMPHIKAGRARALATTGSARLKVLPEVPTVHEQGVAGYEYWQWIGVAAPAKTPPAVIQKLSAALARIVKMPDVDAKFAEDGTVMVGSSPEELRKFISVETKRWRKVAADSNIKLN